jgi:Uma2 family endonuclease
MVSQLQPSPQSKIIYPESDGKPMADNTVQFRWITTIQQNLDWLFANDPNVFVAGDLLWYPVEGDNTIRQAPDILVVFGRTKGDRGSYQQWKEENIAPQVVFEILSPGNTQTEMNRKLVFYDRYGVEEYYIYDPDKNDLGGWLRSQGRLDVIDPIDNWISPRLGIRFDLSGEDLQIFRPDGERFATYVEIAQRAEQERQRAEQAEQRAARLAERLRAAGIDPEEIE